VIFEFELLPVEDIVPWGQGDDRSLSWYALTDGWFRMRLGEHVLFEYTDEFRAHWNTTVRGPQYMVVAYARDILQCVGPGITPLPPFFANLASDWDLVARLRKVPGEETYTALRWLGARSPWISYLQAGPEFQFIRTGDDVQIHWDNRELFLDGIRAWTAVEGSYVLPVEAFLHECRDFADRLLAAMEERIDGIEAGTMRPQLEVDPASLREQHERFRTEFAEYFEPGDGEPDIPWDEAEAAVRAIMTDSSAPSP
jgi:Family of unknown function (DUF5984)